MKRKWLIGLALIVIALLGMVNAFGTMGIEKRPYKITKEYKDFELRHYSSVLLAEVDGLGPNYKSSSSTGFRVLAGYIFGANEHSQKIAMTSPVSMEWDEGGAKMQFMIPKGYAQEELPKPTNGSIVFKESGEGDFAAITFRGWANENKIADYKSKLIELLEKEGIAFEKRFIYLGYDPPYKFIGRRNEILIPLK